MFAKETSRKVRLTIFTYNYLLYVYSPSISLPMSLILDLLTTEFSANNTNHPRYNDLYSHLF